MRSCSSLFLLAAVLSPASLHAEEPVHRLTLRDAVAHALVKHPTLNSASARESVAEAKLEAVRSEASLKLGVVGQVNRSTGNVVPGATFGMSGIPGVSGPPGSSRFGSGSWQSGLGVTASWDVLELWRRPAVIGAADREVTSNRAQSDVIRLLVVSETADSYFQAAEARSILGAAEASEKRASTFHEVISVLVGQKLRPELDLAKTETDLAQARVSVEKARLGVTTSSMKLAEALGEPSWQIEVLDSEFSELPTLPADAQSQHPAVVAYEQGARAAEARANVERLAMLPKVDLLGSAWLRGGGYVLGGGPNSGTASGLLPDTPNWALGVVATWYPTEISGANAKARMEGAEAAAQRAKAAEVTEALSVEVKIARATMVASVAVARATSSATLSAKKTLELAMTRYTTGLGNVLEVAEAERALAAAEKDEAVARFEAWRALVAMYKARGDLEPLAGAVGKAKG